MAKAPLVLRLLLSAAYLCAGIFTLVKTPFQSQILDWSFGLACIAYGLYRGSRAIKSYKAENEIE